MRIDKLAEKEIKHFPAQVQSHIFAVLRLLARDGKLEEPISKKIDHDLFEIRIHYGGQWRVIYAYLVESWIIILSAFQKKTQKTPKKELSKAKYRLKGYKI